MLVHKKKLHSSFFYYIRDFFSISGCSQLMASVCQILWFPTFFFMGGAIHHPGRCGPGTAPPGCLLGRPSDVCFRFFSSVFLLFYCFISFLFLKMSASTSPWRRSYRPPLAEPRPPEDPPRRPLHPRSRNRPGALRINGKIAGSFLWLPASSSNSDRPRPPSPFLSTPSRSWYPRAPPGPLILLVSF
jgi:hypothetical protein